MLANLLAHTALDLNQLSLSSMKVRMSQKSIAILRITMPQHQTPQMRNIISLEESVPTTHPSAGVAIQHHSLVLWSRALCRSDLAALDMFEGHLAAVFSNELVPSMFFICEECGGSVFSKAGCNGEATGTSSNDENIVDLFIHFEMFQSRHLCCDSVW